MAIDYDKIGQYSLDITLSGYPETEAGTEDLINDIYQGLFGRDADAAGLAHYVAELEGEGGITRDNLARHIMGGAQNSSGGSQDGTIMETKSEAIMEMVQDQDQVGDELAAQIRQVMQAVNQEAHSAGQNYTKPSNIQDFIDQVTANNAPVAEDDTFTVTAGQATDLDVLANDSDEDGDAITLADTQLLSAPDGAETSIAIDQDNQDIDFSADTAGNYTFLYSIADSEGGTDTAEVTVTVEAANSAPVAVDDEGLTAAVGETSAMDVLANDSDPDGDTISLASVEVATSPEGSKATVEIDAENGVISFNTDTEGSYTVEYTIQDDKGAVSDAAQVFITAESGTQSVSLDDLGTQQTSESLDAADGTIQYTDDATAPNFVKISNFDTADDSIEFANATADDVLVDAGADTVLTVNNDGTVSQITLIGVESGLGTGAADLDFVSFAA